MFSVCLECFAGLANQSECVAASPPGDQNGG